MHRFQRPFRPLLLCAVVFAALVLTLGLPADDAAVRGTDAVADGADGLRPADSFRHIEDESERSLALIHEAGKVLLHPRCVNCHPAGDQPLQQDGAAHEPPVWRGPTHNGAVGMECSTCHLEENYDPGGVPGAPHWHLAPRSMAWEGLTLGEICRQVQDPERNGGRDLDAVVEHMREDALVAWGWNPGAGREPAPGTHEVFGELIRQWARTGAECPE